MKELAKGRFFENTVKMNGEQCEQREKVRGARGVREKLVKYVGGMELGIGDNWPYLALMTVGRDWEHVLVC